MSWLFLIFFLGATLNNLSEAIHQMKLPSAVVVGIVYCDTCFQQDLFKNSHFISGATVSVECRDENSRPSFQQEVKTDEQGEFKVQLPFSVGKDVKRIKRCSVKLISSSEPYCAVSSRATSSSLRLKSRKQGEHIFSAGFFSFKPENQPDICSQKPSIRSSNQPKSEVTSLPSIPPFGDPTFPPPLQDPPIPDNPLHLPPLLILPTLPPLPQLPPLPSLPRLPNLPLTPGKTTERKPVGSSKSAQFPNQEDLDPNDLLPTPPFIPRNPFQPPPLIPPIPVQPPPSPLIPLPPFPGLTPPPAAFPVPIPPFPFIPSPPRLPGIPPSSSSSSSSQKPSP